MYKRTKYNGDYRDFGIEAVVEGYCLPEKSLFCHFDKHNDYRSGYNVFVGAVLCKSEKVEGEITDVRYLCGGYTRVAAGDYMDRKCIADVAAEEWEKTYSELPKARRDVGPSLLDLRPKKGYAGRQPHANKQAGDYAICASELGIVFDKFKKKHGYELPLAARLEVMYLSAMTSKAMQLYSLGMFDFIFFFQLWSVQLPYNQSIIWLCSHVKRRKSVFPSRLYGIT